MKSYYFGALEGGKFSTQELCNRKNLKMFHISFMGFSRLATWEVYGRFAGRALRIHRRRNGSVLSWLNMGVWR